MSTLKDIEGLPVFDAKRAVKLHITKGDITKADVKEPAGCAVARACRRELSAFEARVHLSRVYIRTNEGNWLRYITPKNLRQEIIAFDRGGSFLPGEFILSAPQPSKVLGKRSGGKKPGRKTGKKRRSYVKVKDVRTGPA